MIVKIKMINKWYLATQGKFSLYNRCFYDVNGMVYTTFTIVNIPYFLYHVFFTLCIFDGFITTVVLRVFLM